MRKIGGAAAVLLVFGLMSIGVVPDAAYGQQTSGKRASIDAAAAAENLAISCEIGQSSTVFNGGSFDPSIASRLAAVAEKMLPVATADDSKEENVAVTLTAMEASQSVEYVTLATESSVQLIGRVSAAVEVATFRYGVKAACNGTTRLELGSRGAVVVQETPEGGQRLLGQFEMPWAFDSQGDPMKTWFEVDGSTLIQHVDASSAKGDVFFDPTYDGVPCGAYTVNSSAAEYLDVDSSSVYTCPQLTMFYSANGYLPARGYWGNVANDFGYVIAAPPSSPSDSCSFPGIQSGLYWNFELPCRAHDYCYDLRKAGFTNSVTDDDCDSIFGALMRADCNDRNAIAQYMCDQLAAEYYLAVRLPNVYQSANPGWTTLRNTNSLKCADVPAGSAANGLSLQQYTCNYSSAQHFRFVPVGGQWFQMQIQSSGKCAATTLGSNIQQWPCSTSNNLIFKPVSVGTDIWTFHDNAWDSCWDVAGSAMADGALVLGWGCSAFQANQHWQIRLP